ncbi:MAG: DUF4145 domain-containing protein [Pseudomonadota bacterium]
MKRSSLGYLALEGFAVCCANPECEKPTIHVSIRPAGRNSSGTAIFTDDEPILTRRLMPDSMSRVLPDCIPVGLAEDYYEACKIRDLSPKSSATLARRCLQGMIRDFAGISEKTLYLEIEKLKELAANGEAPRGVSEDSIEAMHHLRSLGNIGAHMEADINLIVPVEPDEAQLLIELLESLFDEWYIARHKRQQRFSSLKKVADEKQSLRRLPKPEQA